MITSLTPRERKVAKLVSDGLTNKQVGERLGISWQTARTHLWNASRKTGAHTRTTLARLIRDGHVAVSE